MNDTKIIGGKGEKMRNKSKRNQRIAIAALIIVIVLVAPIYYFMSTSNQVEPYLSLEVKGKVFVSGTFTLSDYLQCTKFSIETNFNTNNTKASYEGVALVYFLSTAKCYDDAEKVIIQSADGSSQTFTINYVTDNAENMMLAYKKDGQNLSVLNNGEGPLRLIIAEESAEICLKNAVTITVQ